MLRNVKINGLKSINGVQMRLNGKKRPIFLYFLILELRNPPIPVHEMSARSMKNYMIAILISLSFLLQLEILLKGDVTFTDLLKISKELRDILDPKVDKIYAGDIFAAVDIMNILNQQTSGTMKNITKEELTDFLEVRIIIDLINCIMLSSFSRFICVDDYD